MENETLIKKIERKFSKGHDDFYGSYCITKEDWEKIKEVVKEEKK